MKKTVLIAGGSGLIGQALTQKLTSSNYEVRHLVRAKNNSGTQQFLWNPEKEEMEDGAFENVNIIINLAGENVGGKLWTESQKSKIKQSRIDASSLLEKHLSKMTTPPELYIGASASGYYGAGISSKIYSEIDPPGNDFLSDVCIKWEEGHQKAGQYCDRTIIYRIGVVLSMDGGALPKIIGPMKFAMGTVIGSGKQMIPWVHIRDVVSAFLWAIEQKNMAGIYDLAAPGAVSNQDFTHIAAKQLNRFVSPIPVPEFALKLMLGEQASLVTTGYAISADKLQAEGFSFEFETIEPALKDLLS